MALLGSDEILLISEIVSKFGHGKGVELKDDWIKHVANH